jgi:site-specific recombinase XerD
MAPLLEIIMSFVPSLPAAPSAWLHNSPLAPHLDAFAAHLACGGYSAQTTRSHFLGIAHFGRWMTQCALPVSMLDEQLIQQFLMVQLEARSPLLPNREGEAMTRDNVSKSLALAVIAAAQAFPDLCKRHVSPHTIRHTTAMHLLQSGVDISVIALWLGHESPTTTHHYVEADLAMKDRALARMQEPDAKIRRYKAPDSLLAFLKAL